ncbi:Zona pellucida sperm-binding protein 2 [Merluccius polli]|uniref:Zona pellucida sperm-binding protein 2 n=1 Tax=Merluccius polli TaxID=89951 RepID=A0AA47MCM6_MERPO|nr:Zona pellucida sperm-binding protein 2 [Merluccius polli]
MGLFIVKDQLGLEKKMPDIMSDDGCNCTSTRETISKYAHLLSPNRWQYWSLLWTSDQLSMCCPLGIQAECLGNVMRVSAGPLGGNFLEVAVRYNNSIIPITTRLASQCGFSLRTHPLGRVELFVSLQNCFAHNVVMLTFDGLTHLPSEDKEFTTTLSLRVYGNGVVADELYHIADTCQYPTWASREIICDPDFMEASDCRRLQCGWVSVRRALRDDSPPIPFSALPEPRSQGPSKLPDPRRAAKAMDMPSHAFQIKAVVFFSPDERPMTVTQALGRGYGVTNSPTRLVLRGSPTAPDAYYQDVAGVPMTILKTSTIFEKKWIASQIYATVACPTGGVSITDDMISWFMPRHIDPLISADKYKLLEVHMGVDGQRLDAEEMAARKYSLNINDVHIVTKIPVGAVGGYLKSTVKNNEYYTWYTIAPMLEMLWAEDENGEETRYKVLFSITTPPVPMRPQLIDHTIPGERLFKVTLGPFATDMALVNITFSSVVLSVAECNARGFNVQELVSQSGFKTFMLQVPFMDPLVMKTEEQMTTLYSLHLIFGLRSLPELSPLAYAAYLDATLAHIVPPFMTGSCDHQNFYVMVKYGTPDFNFQIVLGNRMLTPTLAEQYGLTENGTHIVFATQVQCLRFEPNAFLSYGAIKLLPLMALKVIEDSHIKSRLDMALRYPRSSERFQAFSLSCSFISTLAECYPNGTMTALAVKFASAPHLNPSQLTLNDPTCGPVSSDDRFAYFVFSVNSCGTTRKFLSNALLYENEISLPESLTGIDDADYELKVKCYYDFNTTHSLTFIAAQANNEPYAEPAKGDLQVIMRLASDDSFTKFHRPEDYPIPKNLKELIYIEVELTSTNPQVSVELESCWATQTNDRTAQLRWNLIINGCPNQLDPNKVVFHPVYPDSRVLFPSHYKRFESEMFAFALDQDNLSDQLFLHCDVVLCDANNMSGPCSGQCSSQGNEVKGQRRSVPNGVHSFKDVSFGPISIIKS